MPAELLFEPAVFVLFIFIFSPSVSADDFIRVGVLFGIFYDWSFCGIGFKGAAKECRGSGERSFACLQAKLWLL